MSLQCYEQIKSFNKFYFKFFGLSIWTGEHFGYSAIECYIVTYLWNAKRDTQRGILKRIKINEGYLSRVIQKLTKDGLIKKNRDLTDKRKFYLALTRTGINLAKDIDDVHNKKIVAMLRGLPTSAKESIGETFKFLEVMMAASKLHSSLKKNK